MSDKQPVPAPNNVLWQVEFADMGQQGSDYVTRITVTAHVAAGTTVFPSQQIKPLVVTSKTPVKDAAEADHAKLYRWHIDSRCLGNAMLELLVRCRDLGSIR